jgi:hypothetical protein
MKIDIASKEKVSDRTGQSTLSGRKQQWRSEQLQKADREPMMT